MPNEPLLERERAESILHAFFAVHRYFGSGFLESIYAAALELKATELLADHARRQLLGSLCAKAIEVGLLLRFGPRPRFFRYVQTSKRSGVSQQASAPRPESPNPLKDSPPHDLIDQYLSGCDSPSNFVAVPGAHPRSR